jgi:hypothetical protein
MAWFLTPVRQAALAVLVGSSFLSSLSAQAAGSLAGLTRVALFQPAGDSSNTTLTAVLSTVADSVELSLVVLQRYDVRRLPSVDPDTDLPKVRAYCEANRIDQAILGSAAERPEGGFSFRLLVYDRRTDSISIDRRGSSGGVLDMFDTTDALVAALLDGLSGTHLLFGSLSVDTDPAGATVSVNGRDAGAAPLSLRGLPVGTVQVAGRLDGHEEAQETVTIPDGETASASLKLPRSVGRLTLRTPADVQVTVSNEEIGKKLITGPASLDLPTGDYQVSAAKEGLESVSGKVTVVRNAGVRWAPWTSRLAILDALSGSTVKVDGEIVDPTLAMAGGVDVPAGRRTVSVAGPSGQVWAAEILLNPGSVTRQSVNRMTWQIPTRTIDLDGAPSQWAGLVPFWSDSKNYGFYKGQPGTHIAQGFACRDEKNLYVRFDFSDGKPSTSLSRGVSAGLAYSVTVDNPNVLDAIHVGISFGRGATVSTFYSKGTKGEGAPLPGLLTYRIGQSDIEMSISLDFIKTRAQGTPFMRLEVGGRAVGDPRGTGQMTDSRKVDFGL